MMDTPSRKLEDRRAGKLICVPCVRELAEQKGLGVFFDGKNAGDMIR